MSIYYLTGLSYEPTTEGYAKRDKFLTRTWTAEDHRREARRLLEVAGGGDTTNRLLAAQVHATLAVSLADHEWATPEAAKDATR